MYTGQQIKTNQSEQRANDSSAFSDEIASIFNSTMAESLDEDREDTIINM